MKQLCDILGAETVDSIPYRLNEVLFYGDSDRDPIYRAICDMYANNLSYDWFYDFYQSLYAQRKDLKQDFTPKSISDVLLRISSSDSAKITYEPSAGTGSLLIRHWWRSRNNYSLFNYSPIDHIYICSEKSSRSIPFLLFNLSVRGIQGVVFHEDTLTEECSSIYLVANILNNPLCFSQIIRLKDEKNEYKILSTRGGDAQGTLF